MVYLRVKKVSKYFIDSIFGKTYTKELIVENEIQEIKKSDLIENWIKLLKYSIYPVHMLMIYGIRILFFSI